MNKSINAHFIITFDFDATQKKISWRCEWQSPLLGYTHQLLLLERKGLNFFFNDAEKFLVLHCRAQFCCNDLNLVFATKEER